MMRVPVPATASTRPAACPFCASTALGTLAKTITVNTHWRCAKCGRGWSATSLAATARLPRTRRVL